MANGIITGPPQIDFYKMLGGVGDTLQANQKLQQQQQLNDARKAAFSDFSALDPSSPDYGRQALTIAQKLGSSGDQEGALKFITLAGTSADRERQARRDAAEDKYRSASLAIQRQNADRLNATPLDTAEQRAAAARRFGIDPTSKEGLAFALTGKLPDSVANGGVPEVGLSPAYGTGPDGKPAAVQFSKSGTAVLTKLPEGFSLSREPIRIDQGTSIALIDPITRQQVGVLPKDVSGVERQKTLGDEQAKAQVALPAVMASSQQILKALDDIENHPGKQWSLGMYSKVPTIPGTEQANFRAALGQLRGQTFLQAYQNLRGGGAITEVEGQKAENAIARMDTAQTKEAFDLAVKDFRDVVKAGMLRASAKAKGPSSGTGSDYSGMAQSGVKWSVE